MRNRARTPLDDSPQLRAALERARAGWAADKLDELTAVCNGNRAHAERVLAVVVHSIWGPRP